MLNIIEVITKIESFIGSLPFLLAATSISFFLKAFILTLLISRSIKFTKISRPLIFILFVLIGSMIYDSAWILLFVGKLSFIKLDYRIYLLSARIAWAFYIIQFQSLALFIENLSEKKQNFNLHQKIFTILSSILSIFFIILAFYDINCLNASSRTPLEVKIQTFTAFYLIIFLTPLSLVLTILKIKTSNIPRILKRQLRILIQFMILPLLASELLQIFPGYVSTTISNRYAMVGFTTFLTTFAILHCIRKIMGLRFLNIENHVQAEKKFSFIDDFKSILDQFAEVTNTRELGHITQNFFKDAFHIPTRRTRLYIRNIGELSRGQGNFNNISYNSFENEEQTVESFISNYGIESNVGKFLRKNKIVINDEIEFSNFYNEDSARTTVLLFMNNISADVFIPIFENGSIGGYIIIEKYARVNNENKNAPFYSNLERDQMLVFSNYIGNIIKLMQARSLNSIIQQEKELKEELYNKHQEINQYKESIKSFLKNTQQKKIGVIFYKNKKFNFGNQTAQELIPVKLNTHDGHPITKKLKTLGAQVIEYKSPKTCFIQDEKGEKLVVSALLNTEQNNVIMITYYPEISDLIKRNVTLLKDPTQWDYLLYLETTKSGKLINELIPGNGETLLNFKIDLLKLALNKKAILLDMPEQDIIPTVEILHHISIRETLHILDLQQPSENIDTAVKLFGINPIFEVKTPNDKPILKKLDNNGTLFIKNIQFLSMETQKYLAEFIKYGFFRTFKGDQKTFSSVRIICSTNVNLNTAVQDGKFSQALYDELNKTSLSMPSLMTLPQEELDNLTTKLTEQAIKTDEFQHVLELTNTEKKRLVDSRPSSFVELKNKIQQILIKKSKNNSIYEEAQFDPAYDISDPQLVEAVRLGKQALKDRKIMTMLWEKFENQNKIANLLGVNRSSVNRRCKEYKLL